MILRIKIASLTQPLTHWGRVTNICVSKLTSIGSDNGLSPGRRQAIIWTNAGIVLIRTLGTNFSEILCEINSFSLSKMHLKMSSATWRLFGLGLKQGMFEGGWEVDNRSVSSLMIDSPSHSGNALWRLRGYIFVVQISQCTSPVSHNAPFYAHFCYKMLHRGIFVWCIVRFVRWVF